METSSKAIIDRHQSDEIDQHPPYIIVRHPPDSIDLHPPNIERRPLLDKPHDCIVEMEPIEERMHKSEASHLVVHEHQRPPICAEEAVGIHKRVKRIHDHVKIVVPCAVFDVEFPIHPDKSVHLGSYNGLFDDHTYAVASQRRLRCRGEVDKDPAEVA
ncbi:hypothetical protein DY000_02016023 [Brassica cretica]|uniref:Uncharacterized protein n=1 Tax=Brassica cretica TaxID=69181 RepID=A0ABQ7CX01_BRACR|nr:hypothetical protein DY000_02016023 [Brassica cretica]